MAITGTLPGAFSPFKNAQHGPWEMPDGNLYAVLRGGGANGLIVIKSTDNGATWSTVHTEMTTSMAHAADVHDDNIIITSVSSNGTLQVRRYNTITESMSGTGSFINVFHGPTGQYHIAIAVQSDGSYAIAYNTDTNRIMGTNYRRITVITYQAGTFTQEATIDFGHNLQVDEDAFAIIAAPNSPVRYHVFWRRFDGTFSNIMHRSVQQNGGVSNAQTIATTAQADAYLIGRPAISGTHVMVPFVSTVSGNPNAFRVQLATSDNLPTWLPVSATVSNTGGNNPQGYNANMGAVTHDGSDWHAVWINFVQTTIFTDQSADGETWGTDEALITPSESAFSISANWVGIGSGGIGVIYDDNGTIKYHGPDAGPAADTYTLDIDQRASIATVNPLSIGQRAAIAETEELSINQTAAIQTTHELTVGQRAAISIVQTHNLSVDQRAAIATVDNTLTVDQSATLSTVDHTVTVGQSAAIETVDHALSIGTSAAISLVDQTHTVDQRAAIETTNELAIGTRAAISREDIELTAGQSAAIETTNELTIGTSASVAVTLSRTLAVGQRAAIETVDNALSIDTRAALGTIDHTLSVDTNAAIETVDHELTVDQAVAIETDIALSIGQRAAITEIVAGSLSVGQRAAIAVEDVALDIGQSGAISTVNHLTVDQTASIETSNALSIGQTASISVAIDATLSIDQLAAIRTVDHQIDVGQGAAIETINTLEIAQRAAITIPGAIKQLFGGVMMSIGTEIVSVNQTAPLPAISQNMLTGIEDRIGVARSIPDALITAGKSVPEDTVFARKESGEDTVAATKESGSDIVEVDRTHREDGF